MAFSQSIRKGQIPLCCNLCEVETKINWKCIDCNLLMCRRCKESIHPKIKNTLNHRVIDIKEAGLQTEEPDFTKMKCTEHSDQGCFMFCKTCQQLVCPQCVAETHNHGHDLVQISEGYVIKVQMLKEKQQQIKTKIDKLEKEETQIQDIKKAENDKYVNAGAKIQAQKVSLYKAVDTNIEKLQKRLDRHKKTAIDSIEKEEIEVFALKKKTTNRYHRLEDVIDSNDPEKIFKIKNELEKHLEERECLFELNFPAIPLFLPGEITEYNVGSLQYTSDITCRVVKEYTTDISDVISLTSCADFLWIRNDNIVQKVQPDFNNLKVISIFEIRAFGMTVTPTNDFLLASYGSLIKQLSTGKLQDSVYRTEQLQPTAVHVTNDYKVLVGVKNIGKDFPVSGKRAVICMDKEGKHKKIYEQDKNNKPIFTYPRSITSTHSGNICVVDRLFSDARGRVVVLRQEGHIVNIYTGNPDINTDIENKPFRPVSIITSPSDKIIVCEQNTFVLHILNDLGHAIKHVNTEDIGIINPYSTVFTSTRKFYIGCSRVIGSAEKAKLYELKKCYINSQNLHIDRVYKTTLF